MQTVDLRPLGLITKPNPLGLPPGAMSAAKNWMLERPGLLTSRRGHSRGGLAGGGIHSALEFDSKIFANWGSSTATAFGYRNPTNFSAMSGTFTNQPETRMKSAIALGNCFFTTDEGVRRLETGYAVRFAGGVKSIGFDQAAVTVLGTGTVLADGYQTVYRAVFGIKDAQGVEIVGSPSGRQLISNATGTSGYSGGNARNATLRVLLPKDNDTTATALTTSHFIRLYRAKQVPVASTPGDDLQLVYQANLTAGNISSGYVDVADAQPEAVLGDYLYTSPNAGDGILNANEPPPRARDLAWWRDVLWYANTLGKQNLTLTLLSTVASTGLTDGDTLTIGAVVYTGKTTPASADDFGVVTSGTVSQNIEATAQNLVAAINKSANNTSIYAWYISGPNDMPGRIYLEARSHSAAGFTAVASAHGTAYMPSLAAAQSSSQDTWANGVYFSKPRQPDAVPLINNFRVGPSNATVDRIYPLRDQLFVFTSAGLYRITGTDASDFSCELFDLSCRLMARETVALVDDHLYAWTTQGFARISEQGVEWLGDNLDAIEPTLTEEVRRVSTSGSAPTTIQARAFAVGNPGEHKYILWTPYASNSVECHYGWCYDTRTKAWTGPWQFGGSDTTTPDGRSYGLVSSVDGLMYLFDNNAGSDSYIYPELKSRTTDDFIDTISDATTPAITKTATWVVQTQGNPGAAKHWREVGVLWGDNQPTALTIATSSELDSGGSVTCSSNTSKLTRAFVHQGAARCARLTVSVGHAAREAADIAGLSLVYRKYGERVVR